MPFETRSSLLSAVLSAPPGNLSSSERWISIIAGATLTAAALSRGGLLRRATLGLGGLALMTRGSTGFCAMKASMTGDAPLRQGLREQWQRTRSQLGGSAGGIETLHDLYTQELQELAGGALELSRVVAELSQVVDHAELAHKLSGYSTELASRGEDLERILAGSAGASAHPDQALAALIRESRKMKQVRGATIRDAAIIDSMQRLLHYAIAAYGSVAAYAKALGRTEEAARLADYADRDKATDAALTVIALPLVNRQSAAAPRAQAPTQARPH
jgi:ferritin-like metal-binding protein YciE